MKKIICLSTILILLVKIGFSQESPKVDNCYEEEGDTICQSEDTSEYEEFFCGLETRMDSNGELYSIKSCGEGEWMGEYSRSKVRDARDEAELYAKAQIAHFLGEQLTSENFVKKLTTATKKECIDSEGDKTDQCVPKEGEEEGAFAGADIETVKINMKTVSNKADQYLQGVQKIANGPVDKDGKYVMVLVGWSIKSNKAATTARSKMVEGKKNRKSKKKKKGWGNNKGLSGSKSKNFDDF